MYRLLFISLLTLLISCDDGDFEVPSFEFETKVSSCGSYVLYRSNTDKTEVLIVSLQSTDIVNEEGTKEINITDESVIYRIFDGSFDVDYFCADIPPLEPLVLKEWNSVVGSENYISIETLAEYDTDGITITGYNHDIVINNLVLENEGEQMIFESYDFGSIKTSL